MSEDQAQTKQAKIVATAKLSEQQVQQALVEFVSKDNQLKETLRDKQAVAWVNWQVNKWDSPESFCTLSFGVIEEETEEKISEP